MQNGYVTPDGARVATLRQSKCWTQQLLADKVGCARSTIVNVEAQRPTALQTLGEIAQALGVQREDLLIAGPLQLPISVFISYSREDRQFVETELIEFLRRRGIRTCGTDEMAHGDDEFEGAVPPSLRSCDFALVVLSNHAVESDSVKAEVEWAMENRIGRVVPLLREECDIAALHFRLPFLSSIDYRGEFAAARTQLLATLRSDSRSPATEPIESGHDVGYRAKDKPPRRSVSQELPGLTTDQLHFSVTSPSVLVAGHSYVVDVWAHLKDQRHEVLRRAEEESNGERWRVKTKGPVRIARGTTLAVRMKIPGLTVEPLEDRILWEGEIGNANFSVSVPGDAPRALKAGIATVHHSGLCLVRLNFVLQIGTETSNARAIVIDERRYRKAFASYATTDYRSVLARIQGMRKAAPQLDVFYAEHSLRSGEDWKKRLQEEIVARDVFYLFWSRAASVSEWVEWEWKYALRTRGIDYIDPVPLVSPKQVSPPAALSAIHFNDWELAYLGASAVED